MKGSFKHPVFFDGELLVMCPTPEMAASFHTAIHSQEELEIVPPPPPMVGESGIPTALFERGDSAIAGTLHTIELSSDLEKGIAQMSEIAKWGTVESKASIKGKVFLYVRRN